MKFSAITYYTLAAVFQTAGSSGAGMLAPFFMKAHGFSMALVGIPLVANGIGRICSDLFSGLLATYFSSGILLISAVMIGLSACLTGILFRDVLSIFLAVWIVLGLTEAMFALSLRKIAFDQSPQGQQGRAQGQVAAAIGIGYALGPLLGGLVGKRWGPEALFFLYVLPQATGLILIFLAGGHRGRKTVAESSVPLWREGRKLLAKPPFLASCLAIFQSFVFLVGVTRIAFPFFAVNRCGLSLDTVGTIVALSRLTDTFGRLTGGWLCDRVKSSRVILFGVFLGIPMFMLQTYGSDFFTLLIPLSIMTMGFGFTNVSATTFALQSAGNQVKGLALGVSRASTSLGNIVGPLLAGALVEGLEFEGGFQAMALISLVIFLAAWYGLSRQPQAATSASE